MLYIIYYCSEDFGYYVIERYWSTVVFSCNILVSGKWWPYKESWEVTFSFSEKLYRIIIVAFLNVSEKSPVKLTRPGNPFVRCYKY